MIKGNINLKHIYNAIEKRRLFLGISWSEAALQVSPKTPGGRSIALSTIKGLNNRKIVEGDGVLQMLLWLNKTPESFIVGFENSNADCYKLPYVPEGRVLRWNTQALYLSLKDRCENDGISWKEAASQIGGYSVSMLTNLKNVTRVSFPNVMNIVTWLDQPAVTFTHILNS
jgi:hypothetical protein